MRREGYAKVDSWGLDLRALRAQVRDALQHEMSGVKVAPPFIESQRKLPALEPLLANGTLAAAISEYLGGPVRYDGHVLLSLSPKLDPSKYLSAHWHHDRCGRRVKVFVFLHDVHPTTKPTLIVPRTHTMWYYQQIAPVDVVSRFTQGYAQHVASQLGVEVTPLTGPAGGGFLFDTNALHRGMHDSGTEESRTAVILEFHAHGKIAGLRGHDGPCPSAAPKSVPGGFPSAVSPMEKKLGRGNYPLYPMERPAPWFHSTPVLKPGASDYLPGVCGISLESSDCKNAPSGAWPLSKHPHLRTVADCAQMCRQCGRCNYISFSTSPLHNECAWYHSCDLGALEFFGTGPDYITAHVPKEKRERREASRTHGDDAAIRTRPPITKPPELRTPSTRARPVTREVAGGGGAGPLHKWMPIG